MGLADTIYGPLMQAPPPGAIPTAAAAPAAAAGDAGAVAPRDAAPADGARQRRAIMLLVGFVAVAILLTQITVRGELEVSA